MGLTVGLTGGIGAGKSTVAALLEKMGIPVFDSDDEAKRILESDPEVIRSIIAHFGEESYVGGRYNPSHVAKIVFSSPSLLSRLNQIAHPPVVTAMKAWAKRHEALPCKVVESAILFESGLDVFMDKIVVVRAPLPLRISRVMSRSGLTREQVQARIARQMDFDALNNDSIYYIDNNEATSLIAQVSTLVHEHLA